MGSERRYFLCRPELVPGGISDGSDVGRSGRSLSVLFHRFGDNLKPDLLGMYGHMFLLGTH